MTSATRSAPNTFSVASDDGVVIGTITTSALGFIAWSAGGRSLGGYSSMDAAVAALENAARK
jgi:hypothetical protein